MKYEAKLIVSHHHSKTESWASVSIKVNGKMLCSRVSDNAEAGIRETIDKLVEDLHHVNCTIRAMQISSDMEHLAKPLLVYRAQIITALNLFN